MRVILSSTGTSILTNLSEENVRKELIQNTNKKESELSSDFIEKVIAFQNDIEKRIISTNDTEIKKISAELNGILSFYETEHANSNDIHILIGTDTFLCRLANEIIESYLKNKGFTCINHIIPGLNTRSKQDFDKGIKSLLQFIDETIPEYKKNHYKVVFNLTAGFKSLQGFLSAFGTFYADLIVYIFESGGLISIPKLPISIDVDLFSDKGSTFALLAQDYYMDLADLIGIPETLLMEVYEGKYGLSNWGLLAWNNIKSSIMSNSLLLFPGIVFENSFKEDFCKVTDKSQCVKIQETIAKASTLLHDKGLIGLKTDGGLQYDNFSGVSTNNTPVGHFRVNISTRISCVFIGNILRLRFYGTHNYVERNEGL